MIVFRSARIPMGRDRRLIIDRWELKAGEFWVIAGAGGTGKSILGRVLANVADATGRPQAFPGVTRTPTELSGAWISFDVEREIRARLRRDDDFEWTGRPDEGTGLERFVGELGLRKYLHPGLVKKLKGRGIRHLSTGEFRQVLIAREAGSHPRLAVLDEPFEGLDREARPRLMAQLAQWRSPENVIVLTVNRAEDIPNFATGLALLENDGLAESGPVEGVLHSSAAHRLFGGERPLPPSDARKPHRPTTHRRRWECRITVPEVLIQLNGVSLAYNGRPVLDAVDWRVVPGESWLLTGPNGSGKTTLLNLISGNEARGYGQSIWIFGRKRGSGESVAEIQAGMGLVSAAVQETTPRYATLLEVVGSGLRDSMVVHPPLDGYECRRAEDCLAEVGLNNPSTPFYRLPYGERRLVMIARAMAKDPPLLLLDEPMHGLDAPSRRRVTDLIDRVIRDTGTSVIFVSHRPGDAPASIRKHLRLVLDSDGGPSRAIVGARNPRDF